MISAADSKVKVLLIPTDEELMIAMDTAEIVSRIEFRGRISYPNKEAYVAVNGTRYKLTPKTALRFKYCTNPKEYAEAVEYFAYLVLVKQTIPNDTSFAYSLFAIVSTIS